MKHVGIVFGGVVVMLITAPKAHAGCAEYVGQTVVPKSFSAIADALPSVPKKDEFEAVNNFKSA
jgi:hypothetical protein